MVGLWRVAGRCSGVGVVGTVEETMRGETMITLTLANLAVLLGIAYLLAERLVDRLQAQPIRVELAGPVVLEENGALLRQAIREVAFSVFEGTTLVADVLNRPKGAQ